jgi:hypothetical protein
MSWSFRYSIIENKRKKYLFRTPTNSTHLGVRVCNLLPPSTNEYVWMFQHNLRMLHWKNTHHYLTKEW